MSAGNASHADAGVQSIVEGERKWITVMDTFCEGRVPAWKEEDERPCLYDTREEAEADANDEDMRSSGGELAPDEWNDPDEVVEVIVRQNGSIVDAVDGRLWWEPPTEPHQPATPAPEGVM